MPSTHRPRAVQSLRFVRRHHVRNGRVLGRMQLLNFCEHSPLPVKLLELPIERCQTVIRIGTLRIECDRSPKMLHCLRSVLLFRADHAEVIVCDAYFRVDLQTFTQQMLCLCLPATAEGNVAEEPLGLSCFSILEFYLTLKLFSCFIQKVVLPIEVPQDKMACRGRLLLPAKTPG